MSYEGTELAIGILDIFCEAQRLWELGRARTPSRPRELWRREQRATVHVLAALDAALVGAPPAVTNRTLARALGCDPVTVGRHRAALGLPSRRALDLKRTEAAAASMLLTHPERGDRQIARLTGISQTGVSRLRRRLGIAPPPPRPTHRDRVEAALLADPTRSNGSVGRELGCDEGTVAFWRRQLGLPLSPRQVTLRGRGEDEAGAWSPLGTKACPPPPRTASLVGAAQGAGAA